jgi:ABC-2 type transport system ATP-binding protein
VDTGVTVTGLRKSYGTTAAVKDVSFDVAEGEIFGLLGPNGSGKTTTVECLQGLRRPDEGALDVFGLDPRTRPAQVRQIVGSQLQDSALPDRLKVWEALRLFSVTSPGGPPWERLLDEWGLADRRNTAFGDLSGGQRQRLFVALALISEPRLVVLDEMTTGLDPAARRVAWDLVAAVRDRGTTVILVTHFMDEAQRLCDRLAVLLDGRVVARGTPAELIRSQQRSSVVRFTAPAGTDLAFLAGVAGIEEVAADDRGRVRISGTGPLVARVGHALVERSLEPDDLRVELPTLEDAYLALTGDSSPDEAGER